MPTADFQQYIASFKSIAGVSATVGTLIPAIAYFTNYSPPLLAESSLLTSAISAATVIFAYYYSPPKKAYRKSLPYIIRLSRSLLVVSFTLLVIYLLLLRTFTVLEPREEKIRFQIGFARYDWGLTEEGRKLKNAHPNSSMQEFMLYGRAYSNDRIEIFWKTWSVYLAGTLLILVFLLTFVLWTFGWALIAKHHAISDG